MNHNKQYAYDHPPLSFDFRQSVDRFFVEEVPLYDFTGKGNHLILKIEKSDMSTWKLITVLAKAADISDKEIGYAGLKDKSATTIQYFSLPKQAQKTLMKNLTTPRVKILESVLNKSPLKIGHLKGNRFKIILHHIEEKDAKRFDAIGKKMMSEGIPNYYGYQRFGEDGQSDLQGKKIAHSGKRLKGSREKLMVAAYQSRLFNNWLGERVRISRTVEELSAKESAEKLRFPLALTEALRRQPQRFKLFLGDILLPYPHGRTRFVNDMTKASSDFGARRVSPTGLLCGSNAMRAKNDAYHLEAPFDDSELQNLRGDRRFAWIWPEAFSTQYNRRERSLEVSFYLPKGAYATTLLEEIGKHPLK